MQWITLMNQHQAGMAHDFTTCTVHTMVGAILSGSTVMANDGCIVSSPFSSQEFTKECIMLGEPPCSRVVLEEPWSTLVRNKMMEYSHGCVDVSQG